MEIGISIPAHGPMATVESIRGLAQGAQEMGFGHLAVPDHILVPRSIDSTYPYSASGEFQGGSGSRRASRGCTRWPRSTAAIRPASGWPTS